MFALYGFRRFYDGNTIVFSIGECVLRNKVPFFDGIAGSWCNSPEEHILPFQE